VVVVGGGVWQGLHGFGELKWARHLWVWGCSRRKPCNDFDHCRRLWFPRTQLHSMEASLRSPFASLVGCASGSSGENSSFDLGRSGRRQHYRCFPLGRYLWRFGASSARFGLCRSVSTSSARPCTWPWDRCGGRSGGSRPCLSFVGVDFGRSGGRVVGLVGTRSWNQCVGCLVLECRLLLSCERLSCSGTVCGVMSYRFSVNFLINCPS
jgi:hypothetical protein